MSRWPSASIIELNLIQDNIGWGDYKQEFVLAAEAGQAPDIILSGHEDIGAWGAAGIIIPLGDYHPHARRVRGYRLRALG